MSIEAVKKFGIEWSRKIDKSKPGPPLTKHIYICWKGQSLGRPTARAWRSALSIGIAASRRGNGHWCPGRQRHRGTARSCRAGTTTIPQPQFSTLSDGTTVTAESEPVFTGGNAGADLPY